MCSRTDNRFCGTYFSQTVRDIKNQLKTHLQNGPIYLTHDIFPKQIHDLRYICVSLQGKFQVAEIVSDTRTVHSLHKYMRKFRAEKIEEIEKRIFILSFFVYYNFCKLFFFSNGVTDGWNI
jgi:hypothetical protein